MKRRITLPSIVATSPPPPTSLLADETERDRLLKAELHRQLGRFSEAKEIFSNLAMADVPINCLIELCDRKDRRVVLLAADGLLADD